MRTTSRKNLSSRLALYMAAGGTALTGGEAGAAIIYTDIPDVLIGVGGVSSFEFDINGDAIVDVRFTAGAGGSSSSARARVQNGAEMVAINYSFVVYPNAPRPLDAGENIGPGEKFGTSNVLTLYSGAPYYSRNGYFGREPSEFLGIKFTLADGDHYGWARLRVDPTAFSPQIELFDFAYETTPDQAIAAGATVPEPALALLALGTAAGAVAWRQRRSRPVD